MTAFTTPERLYAGSHPDAGSTTAGGRALAFHFREGLRDAELHLNPSRGGGLILTNRVCRQIFVSLSCPRAQEIADTVGEGGCICEVRVTDTLRVWLGHHYATHGRGERIWYFAVPRRWPGCDDFAARILAVTREVYAERTRAFRITAPDDVSEIVPLDARARVLRGKELVARPWLTAGPPAPWEDTPCVLVADGKARRVPPDAMPG